MPPSFALPQANEEFAMTDDRPPCNKRRVAHRDVRKHRPGLGARPGPTLAGAALVAALALSGCVFVVESDSRYRHGALHGGSSLEAIQPGTTTRAWVMENLGAPDSAYVNESGNEVLRYLSVRERDTEVALFLIFDIDVSEEEIKTLHVEIEADRVKSFWIE